MTPSISEVPTSPPKPPRRQAQAATPRRYPGGAKEARHVETLGASHADHGAGSYASRDGERLSRESPSAWWSGPATTPPPKPASTTPTR
jgi:hypothetical protein